MSIGNLILTWSSLLICSALLQAQDRPFLDEPDDIRHDLTEKEWKEGEFRVPDQYSEKNLQEFQVQNYTNGFRYFIDRNSLETTKDGVTRYILVIRSRNGVDNSSYEGIRCGKREYKIYAYGSIQGFHQLPETGWQHIKQSGHEKYRHVLYQDLICDSHKGKANPPEDIFRAMQNNQKVNNSLMLQD